VKQIQFRKKYTIKICPRCFRIREIYAKGYCNSCYKHFQDGRHKKGCLTCEYYRLKRISQTK
jgi:hypothetical protein